MDKRDSEKMIQLAREGKQKASGVLSVIHKGDCETSEKRPHLENDEF